MTACNYIEILYKEIQNKCKGIPMDTELLDCAITLDIINLVDTASQDSELTLSCLLSVTLNPCSLEINLT